MIRKALVLSGLVFLTAFPAVRAAEESPLAQVPDSAPVVLHVRGVEQTKKNVLALLREALPGDEGRRTVGQVRDAIDDVLQGRAFEGRKLDGVAPGGPVFLMLTEFPADLRDPTPVALVVRVSDYAAFRDGLLTEEERKDLEKRPGYETTLVKDRQVFFIDRRDYAVVTLSRDAAKQFAGKLNGLDRKLPAEAAAKLLGSDLSVYVDLPAVMKEYGEQIVAFRQTLEQGFEDQMKAQGMDADTAKAYREVMKVLYSGMVQFLRDSDALLLTADARPEGVSLHVEVRIRPDTKTSLFLRMEEPTALEELEALPGGQRGYSINRPLSGDVAGPLMRALSKLGPGGPAEAFREALQPEEGAAPTLQIGFSGDLAGEEGIEVSECDDPSKLVKENLKGFQVMDAGTPGEAVLKEKPEITEGERTYRGFHFDRVRLVYDLNATAKMFHVDVGAVRKRFGGDETLEWLGEDGKRFVQVKARRWSDAQRYLDAYLDKGDDALGGREAYRGARKHLPEKASMLGLQETSLYSQLVLDTISQATGGPALTAPRPAPGKEVYAGAAMVVRKDQVAVDLWLPSKIAADVFETVNANP